MREKKVQSLNVFLVYSHSLQGSRALFAQQSHRFKKLLASCYARRKEQVMDDYKCQNTLKTLEVLGQGCLQESVFSCCQK